MGPQLRLHERCAQPHQHRETDRRGGDAPSGVRGPHGPPLRLRSRSHLGVLHRHREAASLRRGTHRQPLPQGCERHLRSANRLRDHGGDPQADAARDASLAPHPRHREHGGGVLHGRHRGGSGRHRSLGASLGQRHRAAGRAIDGSRFEGDRLLARHRSGFYECHRRLPHRPAQRLRLQPGHHDRRRAGGRLPHAGGRHRPQRAHDGEGGDSGKVRRRAGRVPGGRGGRRSLDQRHSGQPTILAPGVQQRSLRALGADRGRLRPRGAGLFRQDPAASRPDGGEEGVGGVGAAALRRGSTRGGSQSHRDRPARAYRTRPSGHRGERVPGSLRDRARDAVGDERRHSSPHRQA